MSGGILVTGTDTGVGKTFVAAALAAALAERMRVAVFKPCETGCREERGELVPADALCLRTAAGRDDPLDVVCPYRYAEPLAPWVAAERAGRPIEPPRIRAAFSRLADAADLVIVESAGGLLVPLTRSYCYADLAADLGLPLLVVAGSRLGAINHALLTLECARGRGSTVLGYVLNHPSPDRDLARQTNADALAALAGPCLASIPWLERPEDASAVGASLAAALLPLVEV